MGYREFSEKIMELKKLGAERVISNFFGGLDDNNEILVQRIVEHACLLVIAERGRKRVVFSANGYEALEQVFRGLPEGCIVEYIYKSKEMRPVLFSLFNGVGLEQYSGYTRITTVYDGDVSPYTIDEVDRRRKILPRMYDVAFGEYPDLSDAEELFMINSETFDCNTDDVYTIDEWRSIISNNECLVHKENGQIVCYYVFKLDGKKLYSNISVNKGPANYIYNLERRVFESFFNKGIRTFYCWINNDNAVQWRRFNANKELRKLIKSNTYLYNDIYIT